MRLFDVDWPPGWRETTYRGLPAVAVVVESGVFFAVRSVNPRDGRYGAMVVRFRPATEPVVGKSLVVAVCPASEVVGRCLLFDTTR